MTRSVRDAAIMLSAMAGTDPQDAATADADIWRGDYSNGLSIDALKGMRIGVLRAPNVDAASFDAALAKLKEGGAELVMLDGSKIDRQKIGQAEFKVLLAELKADLASYLQGLPEGLVPHKTLADIIAFNKANADKELQYFGQDTFETADKEKGLDDPFYLEALDRDVKKPHENPALGVLLCASKDEEVVEYALSRTLSPALIAEYQTQLPDKQLLQAKLHEFYMAQLPPEEDEA